MSTPFSFASVEPTKGSASNAFERIIQVAPYGTGEEPTTWSTIPDKKDFQPQRTAKTEDVTTDAHKGASAVEKYGDDWQASFNFLKIRQTGGDFQPEYKILRAASEGIGDASKIHVRYFDALGADEAYQTVATVSLQEQGSGKGFVAVTLSGADVIKKIANPAAPASGE